MKRGRLDIARQVLRYYNMDEFGRRTNLRFISRTKAEAQIAKFSIALTGARPGDVLAGVSKSTKGALMRVHDHSVSSST